MKGRFAFATLVLALIAGNGGEPLLAQVQTGPNFEVNTLGDGNDGSCGQTGIGSCTLREAVNAANANVNASVITFSPSLAGQTISLSTVGDTTFGPSALVVSTPVTIRGLSGNSGVTIARNNSIARLRLFYVSPSGDLTLEKLTLSNGRALGFDGAVKLPFISGSGGEGGGGGAAGLGGAILNQGALTIEQSTLAGNSAQGGNGGAAGPPALSSSGSGGGGLNGDGNPGCSAPPGCAATDRAGGAGGGGDGGYLFGSESGTGLVVFGRDGGFGGGGGGGAFSCAPYGSSPCYGRPGGNGGFGAGGGGGGGLPIAPTGGAAGFGAGNGANGGGGNGGSGGGGGAGLGGAIFNHQGTVAIVNSTISGNVVQGGNGGNGDSTGFGGDGGSGLGGGLFNLNGIVSLTSSTVANNAAQGGSGGLASLGTGAAAASGVGRGGAIYNLAHGATTGIIASDASLALQNTILSDSTANEDLVNEQQDSNAIVQALTPNIIESAIANIDGLVFGGGSNVDPHLGPLAPNGGPTFTHALLVSPTLSPAIDRGLSSGTSTDQRGFARPVDNTSVANTNDGSDIGAYELQLDSDSDGDLIFDQVDEAPLVVSNRFSDRPLGGRTSGRIAILPAGMTVQIVDHPNSARGVRVAVTGATGQRVTLRLDGKSSSILLRSPGTYTVTDPNTETSVGVDAGGPAELQVVVNGSTFVVEIGFGEEARIIETDSDGNGTVDSVAVEPIVGQITVNGVPVDPGGLDVASLVNTKLAIQRRLRTFELATTLVPGVINPSAESVSIRVGTSLTTIPPGSFVLKRGVYSYAGAIGGVKLNVSIVPQRGGKYGVVALGQGPNFTSTVNPVPVQITIGDDSGIQSVRALIW